VHNGSDRLGADGRIESKGFKKKLKKCVVSVFGCAGLHHWEPGEPREAGLTCLRSDIVEDMMDHHAFGETCSERGNLGMDVSQPGGAGPPTQFFDEVFPNVIEPEGHGSTGA
jgi:hypothetical protein